MLAVVNLSLGGSIMGAMRRLPFMKSFIGTMMVSSIFIGALAQANSLNVSMTDDIVSINAINVSLSEIAEKLGEVSNVPISCSVNCDYKITIDLSGESLEAAVYRLEKSHIIERKIVDEKEVISEIIFLPTNDENNAESNLPTGAPVDGIITGLRHQDVNYQKTPQSTASVEQHIPAKQSGVSADVSDAVEFSDELVEYSDESFDITDTAEQGSTTLFYDHNRPEENELEQVDAVVDSASE